jgi:hypothetical protein
MRPFSSEPELEQEALDAARRAGRDKDPEFWKQAYFMMLAREAQQKRTRDIWVGGLMVSAAVGVVFLVLRVFFHS